ncbi:solute carrier family 25 member 45 isoform X1 [Macrosteles quadrilineatus]|uniref:solute carrier family 25 member 45 isoform X1 n=1 Tax=Macrosteles quadrilineatus TaxID=74068 RepID=UPI0023E0A224|nr:solute carrier family 25 member 45 isoform X1 [Macrosteles quadrilineatus]
MSSVFSSCDFIAGWASGILALVVGHPLDTIKVWSQTLPEKSSTMKIVSTIYKHEGVKGYYKGMMFPLLSAGALNSIFFGVYGNTLRELQSLRGVEQTMSWFQERPYPQWYWDIMYAGCLGGFACSVVNCPVELIKTQMQTQTEQREVKVFERSHKFRNPWECFVYQYKMKGIPGVYKGWIPLLWRDVGSYGVYMVVYVDTCRRLANDQSWCVMMAGANAGVVSWATVVPFDVVKSRIQADSRSNPKYRGMWDCIVKSYRHEGPQVFFRGFWLIILRSIPVNAVIFVSYEFFISLCS